MRLFIALLLCPIFFASTCKAKGVANEKTLLWRVSGPGLKKPSYLFGTIHMLCPEDYLWTEAMNTSLAACDKVCFELDMDEPGMMEAAGAGMIDTSGKRLRDYFSAEQYERLSKFVKDSLGVNLSMMQMLKPVMLQTLFMTRAVNCSFPVSYEANIMEEARKSNKEIIGLEAVGEQLEVFNGIPDDSAASMVLKMADSFASSRKEFKQMLASYKAQDLPALYALVKQSEELGDNMDAFLDDRNLKWVPRIKKHILKAPVFIAVGAAHLYGASGLIQLLKKQGYTLTPVH
jgi:uncharacterized protein YbaP (TraB family)